MKRHPAILLTLCLVATSLLVVADDKNKQPAGDSNLSFTVVKDDNGRPVRNASVILHPVGKDGRQSKGGYQLKTDQEGKTVSDGVPYGMIRVQVIAPGFQTFGDDYSVNQPTMDIQIRLKRPQGQVTIYEKSGDSGKAPDQQPPKQ